VRNDGPADYFRGLLDHMLEGCQVVDHNWRYTYVNEAVLRHARRSRDELLGRTMMEVYAGIERTPMFSALEGCRRSGRPAKWMNEFFYPDGSSGWFELNVQPIPDGLFIMSIDMTAHKKAEAEIRRNLDRLRALRNIDLAILATADWRVALRTVLAEAQRQLHVHGCAVFQLNQATGCLEVTCHDGLEVPPNPDASIAMGEDFIGRSAFERITTRTASRADSVSEGARWFVKDAGAAYATPLIAKGEVLGVLAVRFDRPESITSDWTAFLEALAGQAAMAIDAGRLFDDLQRANRDLLRAYDTTLEGWSRALDLRDRETEGHTERVTALTMMLAEAAGIGEAERLHWRRGALLHDIGKMGVADAILLKPGPLTPDEWAVMKEHPRVAYHLMQPIEHLRQAVDIPYCHHERWDGSGYPRGLAGQEIPWAARVFAVVDVWDALLSDRPYRPKWDPRTAMAHIAAQAGRHFDPDAVDLFIRLKIS
jgi:PAS domain S-box-containing protein/putative nucleotidyltransferase with HDIG domain